MPLEELKNQRGKQYAGDYAQKVGGLKPIGDIAAR